MAISKELRQIVRGRSGIRCEYCRKPDAISAQPFHVDHIISLKHNGSNELDNLAWACFQCNVCKGTDIAGIDPSSSDVVGLFNPRRHIWEDHFDVQDAEIVGKTPSGRITVRLLQMNHPDQVEARRFLIKSGLW